MVGCDCSPAWRNCGAATPAPPEPCAARSRSLGSRALQMPRLPFCSPAAPAFGHHQQSTAATKLATLPPGKYTVTANAKGFPLSCRTTWKSRRARSCAIQHLARNQVEQEKVNVEERRPAGRRESRQQCQRNRAQRQGSRRACPTIPTNCWPTCRRSPDLRPGPNGGQLYIDGFTAGQLPPKSSIREIRINQNPFSAEYDKLGYGRIEIFTKPGHRQISRTVFRRWATTQALTRAIRSSATLRSALRLRHLTRATSAARSTRRHRSSSTFSGATSTKSPSSMRRPRLKLPAAAYNASVPNPRTRTNLGPRIDYQLTPNNTLTARYQYYRDTQQNDGVGGTGAAARPVTTPLDEHTVQISDTQILEQRW